MIDVTQTAASEFKRRLLERGTPKSMIRFGVKGGGCSGYSFSIGYEDNTPRERDRVWNIEDVDFVIDSKSLIFLSGSTVVWRESLVSRGFDIENPNEASRCGCGHSFTVR